MELTRIWATWTSALTHAALRILPVQLSDIQQQSDYGYTTLQACPQTDSIMPIQHLELYFKINDSLHSPSFQNKTYTVLGGAVQIPTESYDDMLPVGQDPRWDVFQTLHDYLNVSFPSVYSQTSITKVNTYGLVFHWQGSDTALKPILLTSHQDVVPVDSTTLAEWEYPPYSGYFDGTFIHGRGSGDDKADLISQLITLELLLQHGFEPKRTIVLAVGFDEESAGIEGAGHLARYLENFYGLNGFALLLDEGEGYGSNAVDKLIFARPGVSEKGYLDVKIEVRQPGGHSSVPPEHTSIGTLAMIIGALENLPHAPSLLRNGTAFAYAQCAIGHDDRGQYSNQIKKLAHRALTDDVALEQFKNALVSHSGTLLNTMMRTTQAVDIIQGGVKINALPELAHAVVNHRIAEDSSVKAVQDHIRDIVQPIALANNLSLSSFGVDETSDTLRNGRIILSNAFNTALEPSPVSSFSRENEAYKVLSGTIQAAVQTSSRYKASGVVVSPSLGLGNTDTQFYWNLTTNIFRYSHRGDDDDLLNGLHTVNEAIRATAVIDQIRFLVLLVLNCDESDW